MIRDVKGSILRELQLRADAAEKLVKQRDQVQIGRPQMEPA